MSADTDELDEDRNLEEIFADPVVAKALHAIGQRLPNDPCPRCLEAPIAQNSPHGWCQPCTTHHEERIKASRRRSYHRNKPLTCTSCGEDIPDPHPAQDPEQRRTLVAELRSRGASLRQIAGLVGVSQVQILNDERAVKGLTAASNDQARSAVTTSDQEDDSVDRLLTISEAADLLGVHYNTARRMIHRGELPVVAIHRGIKRVRQEDVEAYITSRIERRTGESADA